MLLSMSGLREAANILLTVLFVIIAVVLCLVGRRKNREKKMEWSRIVTILLAVLLVFAGLDFAWSNYCDRVERLSLADYLVFAGEYDRAVRIYEELGEKARAEAVRQKMTTRTPTPTPFIV